MKLFKLLLFLGLSVAARAQFINPVLISASDPSGACPARRLDVSISSGGLFYCSAKTNMWVSTGGSGTGDVVGPGSATNLSVVIFDGTTGKLIKVSGCSVASTGLLTCAGYASSDVSHSGAALYNGLTSGGVALAAADVAGTAIAYVLPSVNGIAGQFLIDSGSTTCPTLVAGLPATCHLLQWASACVPGTTITTGTTATLSTCFTVNQEATAGTGVAYTLLTAAANLQYCIDNGWNGSAADTGVLTLTASAAGQFFVFTDGTLSASGGNITSGGAARDGACVYGIDATHWMFLPHSGTWTKH